MLLQNHPARRPDDPRDNLEKARRMELFQYAQANGVTEITHEWAASDMRRLLRQRNLTNIQIPERSFGMQDAPKIMPLMNSKGQEIVHRQAPEAHAAPAADPKHDSWRGKNIADMSINERRWAAKAKGIALDRTDNMAALAEKLKGAGLE